MKVLRAVVILVLLIGLLPLGAHAKAQRLERAAFALALAPEAAPEAVTSAHRCKGPGAMPCPTDPVVLSALPAVAPRWQETRLVSRMVEQAHEGRAPPGALDPPISG